MRVAARLRAPVKHWELLPAGTAGPAGRVDGCNLIAS